MSSTAIISGISFLSSHKICVNFIQEKLFDMEIQRVKLLDQRHSLKKKMTLESV